MTSALARDHDSSPDTALVPGTVVGEYVIDCLLGAGAQGEVYAGEHPVIGKKVAVKVLKRELASNPEMVSRFIAEARAVNKIRQRNIIDIFAFGMLDGERHYFVMELCEGLTLGALMQQQGRLSVRTVIPIVQGIAAALDAVHEAGITHRDLKPENVLLIEEKDGSYFPKLLDFGIAKLMGEQPDYRTSAGVVMGTPRYMSPEQARGKAADQRSDIYALGVMIHEMLTGRAPFFGESGMEVLFKHGNEPAPAMSSVCPDLPPALDVPVLAMLEKHPKDRPETAGKAIGAFVECARKLSLDKQPEGHAESLPGPLERVHKDAVATAMPASPASAPIPLQSAPPPVDTGKLVRTPEKGRTGPFIALVAAVVLLGAAISWLPRREVQNAENPLPTPPASVEIAPVTTPVPTMEPQPMTITVKLSTQPADVDVWLEGRKVGTSRETFAFPRATAPVVLRLKKVGFVDNLVEFSA